MRQPPRMRGRWPRRSMKSRQRGIALLVAILLVALATMIAATLGYENAMTARRGEATFAFDQALLVAQGAEAFAAYGLREIYRSSSGANRTINPSQPWAQPYGPVEIIPGVTLDATLEDLQGRFNLNSLVQPDAAGNLVVDPEARAAFEQLLTMVGIEPTWSGYVIDWIDPDIQPQTPDGAEDSVYLAQNPPYLTPNTYITSTTELLALPGFGRDRYMKLAPYITALPPNVKINLCTASGYVLDAFLNTTREFSTDPQGLAKNRASTNGCFPTLAEYETAYTQANPTAAATGGANVVGPTTGQSAGTALPTGVDAHFQTTSSYFLLSSHITIGTTDFNIYSTLYQDASQGNVRPILRTYTPN